MNNIFKNRTLTRSYNGKVGCMCGCNGTYRETKRALNMATNKIEKALRVPAAERKAAGIKVGVDYEAGHAYVEQNGRNTVVYFESAA